MAFLVPRVAAAASVSEELEFAWMLNNPPPPRVINCKTCPAEGVPYEKARVHDHIGLICPECDQKFNDADRRAKEAYRKSKEAAVAREEDQRRQLGRCIRALLEAPGRPDSKALRKRVKVLRKDLGWKPCEWCSICTRPLVKDNSDKGAKVCRECDPAGEKGKAKATAPVHSDRYVTSLAKLGFGSVAGKR